METGNHFKNGANPKSRMSRGILKNRIKMNKRLKILIISLGVLPFLLLIIIGLLGVLLAAFLPEVNTQAIEVQSSQSGDQQKIYKWFYIHQEYPNVIEQGGVVFVPIYESPDENHGKISYLKDSVFVISEENGCAKVSVANANGYAFVPLKYLSEKRLINTTIKDEDEWEAPKFEIDYPYKQEIINFFEEIIDYLKYNIIMSSIVGALIIAGFVLLCIKYPLFRKIALIILAIIGAIIAIVLILNVIIYLIKLIVYIIKVIIRAIIYIIAGFIVLLWIAGGGIGRQWDRDH